MDNTLNNANGKIFKNIFWSYSERIVVQIVTTVISIILARILVPEYYGILSIVLVFITLCDALVNGGFGSALVQKKDADEIDFSTIFWLSMLLAFILYLVLFFTAPLIEAFYGMSNLARIIRFLGIRIIFSAFNSIQLAYVQKNFLFKISFLSSITASIFSGITGIIFALIDYGVWALVIQNLLYSIVNSFMLLSLIRWKPSFTFSFERLKHMWGYGSKIFCSTLVYSTKDNIRSLVIGKAFSPQDLAYYDQGKKYPSLLIVDIVESLGKVIFPVFSLQQDETESNKRMMRNSIKLTNFILFPLILGLFAVADNFVLILLTEKWMSCVIYLRILSLAYITRAVSTIFQKALLAKGKSGVNLLHELITSIVAIGLIIVSVTVYKSVTLIAFSYVIIAIIGTLIFSIFVRKYYNYKFIEMAVDYLPVLALSIIMCVAVILIGLLNVNVYLELLIQVFVGITIYLLGAIVMKLEEFKQIISLVKTTIQKRRSND